MAEDDQPFTSAVNYKRLICHLKSLGHADVPSLDIVRKELSGIEDQALQAWATTKVEENEDQFLTLLELHWSSTE